MQDNKGDVIAISCSQYDVTLEQNGFDIDRGVGGETGIKTTRSSEVAKYARSD